MKNIPALIIGTCLTCLITQPAWADAPSAFGSGFDTQDFFKPFTLADITPENQQKWPFYKHVSAHWDDYALHGTAPIARAATPAALASVEDSQRLDMNIEWQDGQSFLASLQATQVKGFVVLQDNRILAEFYDNGFRVDDTNLLQSASKTFAAVVTHTLMDQGLLDADARVDSYLEDFAGSDIGRATVQQVLDMLTGLPTLLDLHTPGAPGQLWEIEIGLQPGTPVGHRKTIQETSATVEPGEAYNYTDKNTDTLVLLAEAVTQKKYPELLSDLFNNFGANFGGSIALTSDGTASPSYGLSITARDYALFHQWIAQGRAPKSYYASAMDRAKTKFSDNEVGRMLGKGITYGSQSYYLVNENVLYSSGSYGQLGFSDMENGVAVVFLQDWAVNAELEKFFASRDRALAIIKHLRIASRKELLRGRTF